MDWLAYAAAFSLMALLVTLLARARNGNFLGHFPIFYSYVLFTLFWGTYVFVLWKTWPAVYARVFWFHYGIGALAEFAVLVEISDHLFHPFPAIRKLGTLLTLCLIVALSAYVIPSLLQHRSSTMAILDSYKRAALAKALIILALLAVARHYKLPRGKNILGLMLGFSLFLCIQVVNFALVMQYRAAYGRIFSVVGQLAFLVGVTIWTVVLWRYEPVVAPGSGPPSDSDSPSGTLRGRLEGFDDLLGSAFRK